MGTSSSAMSRGREEMRLWSLHPRYLDARGLVAVWREALLAQAVLRGRTRGYRNHPQLERFLSQSSPLSAIALYLNALHAEAETRGYAFDSRKMGTARKRLTLFVTGGQIEYEWAHLRKKLRRRNPAFYRKWKNLRMPEPHPLFRVRPGDIESWERPGGTTNS